MERCVTELIRHLTLDNFADVAVLADKVDHAQLHKACVAFAVREENRCIHYPFSLLCLRMWLIASLVSGLIPAAEHKLGSLRNGSEHLRGRQRLRHLIYLILHHTVCLPKGICTPMAMIAAMTGPYEFAPQQNRSGFCRSKVANSLKRTLTDAGPIFALNLMGEILEQSVSKKARTE